MIVTPKTDFFALLQDVVEFLDNYVDVVDGEDGRPGENRAMSLTTRCEKALQELEGLDKP